MHACRKDTNFLRRLASPGDVRHWSLATLREKLVKIGAKVIRHAKYMTFQLAEVAIPRQLLAAILDRIARLAIPPPLTSRGVSELAKARKHIPPPAPESTAR